MALVILKEVNRLAGFTPDVDLIAGQPVVIGSSASNITVYTWAGAGTNPSILGLALETTTAFTSLSSIPTFKLNDSRGLVDPTKRPTSDRPSGDLVTTGTFYDVIDRGGLVSVAINGGEFDLYDDGRGAPYVTAPVAAYAVNSILYADNTAHKVTSDASTGGNANQAIGVCLKTPTDNILRIKLTI